MPSLLRYRAAAAAAVLLLAAAPALATFRGNDAGTLAQELISRAANGQGASVLSPEHLVPALRSEENLRRARLGLALLKGLGKPAGFGPLSSKPEGGGIVAFGRAVRYARHQREIIVALQPAEGGWQIAGFHVRVNENVDYASIEAGPKAPPHRVVIVPAQTKADLEAWVKKAIAGQPPPVPEQVTLERGRTLIFTAVVLGYTPVKGSIEGLAVHYEFRDPGGKRVPLPLDDIVVAVVDPAANGVVVPGGLDLTPDAGDPSGRYVVTGTVEDKIRKVSAEARLTVVVP